MGAAELDARFKALHRRVGYRHFNEGISQARQMTGRAYREIQRSIIAIIAGAVPPRFLRAMRAIIDFIYQAQAPIFCNISITTMEEALKAFHSDKDQVIASGARVGKSGVIRHFRIPKLELLQNFALAAKNMGAICYYSADLPEHLLMKWCKRTFTATNHRGYEEQITRILDRQERTRMFSLYTTLRSNRITLVNVPTKSEEIVLTDICPELEWLNKVLPDDISVMCQ